MAMQDTRIEGNRQIALRLPVSLHNELVEIKQETGESVNAQIVELVDKATKRRRMQSADAGERAAA